MGSKTAYLVGFALLAGLLSAAAANPVQPLLSDSGSAVDAPVANCGSSSATVDQSFEARTLRFDYLWKPSVVRAYDAVSGVALAQTFTADRRGLLASVAIRIVGWRVEGDLPVEIRAKRPGGRLLAQGVLPLSAFDPWKSATQAVGSPAWIDVPLEPLVRVAPGDVLAIVLPALAGTQSADRELWPTSIRWWTSPGEDGYGGGTSFAGTRVGNDPGVSAWDEFPNDRHFRTYVCDLPSTSIAPQSIPAAPGNAVPAVLVTLAFLAGAALMLRRLGPSATSGTPA